MRVLHNANVLPPEMDGSTITALAIQNGRIVDIGDDASILSRYGSIAEIENMQGKTIWPGMVDAHIHIEQYALNLASINCDTPTLQECLVRVKKRAVSSRPGTWILGHGWNQNNWAEGFGNADLLDSAAPDNPVFLTSKSLHSAWVNSLAMQVAQITPLTANPQGGIIQWNDAGKPTGILFENAVELCQKAIPQPTPEELKERLLEAQTNLSGLGITGVHDFDGPRCFSALQLMEEEGSLHLRVVKGIKLDDMQAAISLGLRTGFGNEFLQIGPVKLFADGALGPQTAAMMQPYENDAANLGILQLNSNQVFEIGKAAVSSGLSLAVHVIGDRAIHEVLEGYRRLQDFSAENHYPVMRHRVEHVQLIDPPDISRFATNGIVASMQPIHATSDMEMADRYWGARSQHAYAWRIVMVIMDSGAYFIAFSTRLSMT